MVTLSRFVFEFFCLMSSAIEETGLAAADSCAFAFYFEESPYPCHFEKLAEATTYPVNI